MRPLSPPVRTSIQLAASVGVLLTIWGILRGSETTLRSEIAASRTELKSDVEKVGQQVVRTPVSPQVLVQVAVYNQQGSAHPARIQAQVTQPIGGEVVPTTSNTRISNEKALSIAPPTETERQQTNGVKIVRVNQRSGNINMNVRSGPSSNEQSVAYVARGASLQVIGESLSSENAIWYQVQCEPPVFMTKPSEKCFIPSLQTDQPIQR